MCMHMHMRMHMYMYWVPVGVYTGFYTRVGTQEFTQECIGVYTRRSPPHSPHRTSGPADSARRRCGELQLR